MLILHGMSADSAMTFVWLIAMVVLLAVEIITVNLTTIWFALGALAALISSLFGAPVWLQVVWFLVLSIVALAVTKPLVKKYVNSKTQPTNADMVIGKTCVDSHVSFLVVNTEYACKLTFKRNYCAVEDRVAGGE